MITINMKSSADKVKGQGVGSAYLETVALVRELDDFHVKVNADGTSDITHYHTIDLKHYIHSYTKSSGVKLGFVHFLPETIDGSLKLPSMVRKIFDKYILSFYKRMDHLVTVNPYFEEKLVAYGINPDKVSSIPNYVSEKEFYPLDNDIVQKYRTKYKLENKFTVLGVGQVQTRKGILDFIDVASKNPDIQFVWAGGFSFGAITDGYHELKQIVESPPSNVKFLGIIDRSEMNGVYNVSNVLFMPSYNELFPMAILEAMSVNIPILLRNLDIYKEILDGFYIEGDNNTFSNKIRTLKNDNVFYETAMSKSRLGNAYYSRENVSRQWNKLYHKILIEHNRKKRFVSVEEWI
ncbi:glycosyltransferase family 4 protein [Acidaminobacter sp. JC074]|uniref:glycosyltransferase family 4 protein n=1 Tax=Acidaminobacter sp. JC074 TaxID=2530199 RepID=UPI001F0CF3C7|nr:glycosyltransferase family 4 protein [Acidaminobacter sp. JC074]MCH4891365.1 glycosyltransferase family 4 protein [Acidaminobacter sp. JC074]